MERKNKYFFGMLLLCSILFAGGCGTDVEKTALSFDTKVETAPAASGTEAETLQPLPGTEQDLQGGRTTGTYILSARETLSLGAETAEQIMSSGCAVLREEGLPEVTLVMVGDMLMHMPVNNSGKMADGSINFDHLFIYTKDMISEADIALVNEEVILGGEELGISGYPRFNTYYEVGDALVNAGFDVVLHATNHAMDKGREGLENCLAFWENKYPEIAVLGIQDSAKEQEDIYVYEQYGIRIAILNYTYGTNGLPLPEGMPYAVNLMDETKIAEDVARAKELADFVVLCPHWGTEYVLTESKYQRMWAEFFMECGVDLVIGTHPHVIEPVELMKDDLGNEMLVYYSLGNYVNATASESNKIGIQMIGAMAEVTIARNENGEVYIKDYGAEPLVTYFSADKKEVTTYPMDMFTEEMAENSYTVKRDERFSPAFCEEIWQQVFPDLADE
ncbi:MAG: CapA family protein [Lachnospiraceae bacterium]|nr:CapA family protein [Lachnospiraceae bacterium]